MFSAASIDGQPLIDEHGATIHRPAGLWNGKRCAVVLTYDDAIDNHLDKVLPELDSAGLKATFYLIGSSPAVSRRIGEWRKAAAEGHELGNHSLFHPCDGSGPGRGWVPPDYDLSKYTVRRAVNEIKANNELLSAIDGKSVRTFAYPCGDLRIGDTLFYDSVKNDLIAARGVSPGFETAERIDLSNVRCYGFNGQHADYMIGLVKQAMDSGRLVVFLFHGVGGGHNINVELEDHRQLIRYLRQHEKDIWVAPMVNIAEYIREQRVYR